MSVMVLMYGGAVLKKCVKLSFEHFDYLSSISLKLIESLK